MATSALKKVLFTSHVANFQKFNRPLMRMLSEQGYEVHYASDGEEKILDCDKEFTIPFQRSPFSLSNVKAISQLKKIIDREGYEIIHTHTPMGSVVTRLAAIAARKKGTRVIYTAHGFHFFKGAPITNWLIYYPIEKVMARFTDVLITINKEDYDCAKSNFRSDVKYVAGVGVDPKRFSREITTAQKSSLRKSLGIKDSDFLMIYVAELSKRKNQLWLIRSLANLMHTHADIHLFLLGKDSLNGAVSYLIDEMELSSQVHILGYRTDVPDLMKVSDLSVSSSLQEGLPVNVMEAMCVGLPLVVTGCRGNRDFKEDENLSVAALGDVRGFQDLVEGVYLRPKQSIPYIYDTQSFEIETILREYSSIYKDMGVK